MKIADDNVEQGCRLGQGAGCCAFLGIGAGGWECLKADSKCRITLERRLRNGSMNAKGEGDWEGCKYKEVY